MPPSDDILNGLGTIANEWKMLAIFWHVYFGLFAVQLLLAYRPRKRFFTLLIAAPLASVGALAWDAGNPFNAAAFGLLLVLLLAAAIQLPAERVTLASPAWVVVGTVMFGFGWVYPHFLATDALLPSLYTAPTGLLPCPTLSIVIGLALIVRGLDSVVWSAALGTIGLFYGLFGAVHLGVAIDGFLIAGSVCLLIQCAVRPPDDDETD